MCDANAVTMILGFSVAGFTLKWVIQWLKTVTKLSGFLAQALSIAVCFGAAAVYILVTQGDWSCLLVYGPQVYVGAQLVHQVTKK